ncbi:hypothetical protein L0664_00320 [Octadecabacter sp. G9-8]|uniref:Uncharacterized protein n=1 Tax=Octadecabacter dasysiphoniae TaxID=2909341 RepID=A0ABS9CQI2_9RHOB|nr:hypothetical protein [Octadecabacter dasysiphoniae]MCF2869494.1 hypothetical protein [Octadecabacter dasysiphoniae]
MGTGIAGALLVFTGVWHSIEWMMGGRNKDTLGRLLPFGIIYLVLGCLIVTLTGGPPVLIAAILFAATGAIGAFATRTTTQVRSWVVWSFIVIDIAIIACLLTAFIS